MNPRIFVACIVGAILIAVGYLYAPTETPHRNTDASVGVVAGPAPTRQPIAITDSDNDGIPDWQEEFRPTQPATIVLEEENGMDAESYARPDTLTSDIGINAVEGTLRREVIGQLGYSQESILRGIDQKMLEAATDEDLFTEADVVQSEDISREALRVYGNQIAGIFIYSEVPQGTLSEIEALEQAVRSDNPELLEDINIRAEAYQRMIEAMLKTEVPRTATTEHLALLNALKALRTSIEGMANVFDDPVYTLVRTQRYFDDAVALKNTLENLYFKLATLGAVFEEGDLTLYLVRIEE